VIDEHGREWYPASKAHEYSPECFDFRWNEDYTMFRPIRLLWWDEASYIAYQSMD
jgi:hypothetical protein